MKNPIALGLTAGCAAAFLALAACSDQAATTDPTTSSPLYQGSPSGIPGIELKSASYPNAVPSSPAERASAEMIARVLSMALQDSAVREEVMYALAFSAIKEHKLHFASFMQGRGGAILAAGLRNSGVNVAEFARAVAAVRPLEFYMPVKAHTLVWNGDSNVQVAVAAQKNDVPIAFRPDGTRIS